jgi:heme-degrading monooxygenase HmoA
VRPGRKAEYDAFAREVSQRMFEQQPGFGGVIFSRTDQRALVITLWSNRESADALPASPSYRRTVERIGPLLHPGTSVEVYDIQAATARMLPQSAD